MRKVLMHVCCAPCFITIEEDINENGMLIDGKRENVDLTAYWYNPKIHPKAEYERRKDSFIKSFVVKHSSIFLLDNALVSKHFTLYSSATLWSSSVFTALSSSLQSHLFPINTKGSPSPGEL